MSKSTYRWAAVLVALLSTGCSAGSAASGSAGSAPHTGAGPNPAASAGPSPDGSAGSSSARPSACPGLPGARARWLPIPGGRLEANTAGAGPDAVVFLHEIGSGGMCGFAGYAAWLVTHHHNTQVVLVNRCGYGASICPAATTSPSMAVQTGPAVDWAREHGARRVTLVGASGGGMDALEGAALIPGIAAVVDLSGDVNDTGANDAALLRRITMPALLAVAPDDPFCSISAMRGYYAKIPAKTKRLLIETKYPSTHGWDLLFGATGRPTPLAGTVARWIVGRIS